MSATRRFIVTMSLAATTAVPALAGAQTPASALPIAVGQRVWITSADGQVTKGTVQSLTPAIVEIGKDGVGTANLAIADVRRIRIPDSAMNGVVTGALSLGLVGMLYGAVQDAGKEGITGVFTAIGFQDVQSSGGFGAGTGAVVGVAVGALLGYALDAAKVKTIYQRDTGGMSVGVRPIVSAAGKAVGVRVRW